jgi:hypothetical protein
MGLLTSLGNTLGWGTESIDSSTALDTTNSLDSSTGIGFNQLLSFYSEAQTGDSSTSSDTSDMVSSFQSSLLGAMGMSEGGLSALSGLADSSSLASLQNSFLSSLQENLFSGIVSTDSTEETVVAETDTGGIFGSMENIYDYAFGSDGVGLEDAFDSVNILNHIPIVSDVYESVSNTDVSPVSSVLGGYLYGGPVGVAYEAFNMAFNGYTGQSLLEYVTGGDWFSDDTSTDDQNLSSGAHEFVVRETGTD